MRKKGLYFFNVPIYEREIAIFIGLSYEEAIAEAKKQKCNKGFFETIEDTKDFLNKVHDEKEPTEAAACRREMRLFLFLRKPRNHWFFWDTLNHEVFHISQFIGHQQNLWDDVEPPAYLHSWLFKHLRKFLFKKK